MHSNVQHNTYFINRITKKYYIIYVCVCVYICVCVWESILVCVNGGAMWQLEDSFVCGPLLSTWLNTWPFVCCCCCCGHQCSWPKSFHEFCASTFSFSCRRAEITDIYIMRLSLMGVLVIQSQALSLGEQAPFPAVSLSKPLGRGCNEWFYHPLT